MNKNIDELTGDLSYESDTYFGKRIKGLEGEVKLLNEINLILKTALRTIRDDKSFGPMAEKLLRNVARLALMEVAKYNRSNI